MNVYAVMLDDYEAGWPEAIFDNKKDAVAHAESRKDKYREYEVIEFALNNEENGNPDQVVYCTSEA